MSNCIDERYQQTKQQQAVRTAGSPSGHGGDELGIRTPGLPRPPTVTAPSRSLACMREH